MVLCLAVIGGTWWYQTRKLDFLSPPSGERLAEVRARVKTSLPPESVPAAEIASPPPLNEPPPPPEDPKPVIELGDLQNPPALNEYADLRDKGASHLIELAVLLETEGEIQRTLLAWERVLDCGNPDETQTNAAIAAIKRLRLKLPDWNNDPKKQVEIVLQAGTARKAVKSLTPVLQETARELERASAGLLKVSTKITPGKDPKSSKTPVPIAIWLSGPAKDSRSTEVMSFTAGKAESLPDEVRRTSLQVVRGFLGRGAGGATPPPPAEGEILGEVLNSHVTRHQWLILGHLLNQTQEKPAKKP